MDKINDDGHRPGQRTPVTDAWKLDRPDLWTPADREKRRAAMKAYLASKGLELHTTTIDGTRFIEHRKIGAPSVFEGMKVRREGAKP